MTVIAFPTAPRTPRITETDKALVARIADRNRRLSWTHDREGSDEWITLVEDADQSWRVRCWQFVPIVEGWALVGPDGQEIAQGRTLENVLEALSVA